MSVKPVKQAFFENKKSGLGRFRILLLDTDVTE